MFKDENVTRTLKLISKAIQWIGNIVSTKTVSSYRKIPNFLDARKHYYNLPKIQTKTPNLREFHKKGANGIANSEDPDLGLHCLPRPICPKT